MQYSNPCALGEVLPNLYNWGRLVGHGVDHQVLEDLLQGTVTVTASLASCILDD